MCTRNARQCRERWQNYLDPELRRSPWTAEEDLLLQAKVAEYGAGWHKISTFFVNRSPLSLRNRWQQFERRLAKGDIEIEAAKQSQLSATVTERSQTQPDVAELPGRSVSTLNAIDLFDSYWMDENAFDPWNTLSF
jgi:hypothetical protein